MTTFVADPGTVYKLLDSMTSDPGDVLVIPAGWSMPEVDRVLAYAAARQPNLHVRVTAGVGDYDPSWGQAEPEVDRERGGQPW